MKFRRSSDSEQEKIANSLSNLELNFTLTRMEAELVISQTKQWIANVVIGLNLCPFARRVFDGALIRYAVTETSDEGELLVPLRRELLHLAAASRSTVETTILIHPNVLNEFHDYNDFLGSADLLIQDLELIGIIQIASFHPQYQFARTVPDAVENYTNRSPFPMLHLLREASITEVADDPAVLHGIPNRNVETMRRLGLAKLSQLLHKTTP